MGFDFDFPYEQLKSALTVSLLSVWVLVGLFFYLNRYTKRQYFSIWTAAWLFYALWLTLCISLRGERENSLLLMLKQWCVGTSAAFLLWGATRFLKLPTPQRLFGFFMAFLLVWSYIGAYHLEDPLWVELPIFVLIGLSSTLTGFCFLQMRTRRAYIGAGLLSVGFFLWGVYLGAYPFLQRSEQLVSGGFFISAVLQLFIAISMIILVLEEARAGAESARRELSSHKTETVLLRSKMDSTEVRYRTLFDHASEAIVLAAVSDLRILELNKAARRLLGLNEGSLAGQFIHSFCPLSTATNGSADWFAAVSKERQVNVISRNGSLVRAEIAGSPIQLDGTDAYQLFFREVTERTRLEQQLRQAEKLSALGQMISGVAHELNNPLAVIKGYLELILSRHEIGPQTRTDLEKVAHESNRAAKLVNNFLSFAREQPANRSVSDINEIVRCVLDLRKFDLKAAGIEVVPILDPALPPTLVDRDQIQQILVNLVQNAMHAILETTRPGQLRISTQTAGTQIHILVEDNGPGVSAAALPHIFEPFFTTKAVGTGTGLGLSIAYSIMSDHQGRISYCPSALGGAGFLLELPIVAGPGSGSERTAPRADDFWARGTEDLPGAKILILDDEAAIAELLGEMLTLLGYTATLSNFPKQALELIKTNSFDLILSDFRMPNMNGQQFYEEVRKSNPAAADRIIFLTGDVVNEETQAFLKSIGNPHLSKPFQLAGVERAVKEVLRKSSAARES